MQKKKEIKITKTPLKNKENLRKRLVKGTKMFLKKKKTKKHHYASERYWNLSEEEKKRGTSMIVNDIRIFQKMKNKSRLSIYKIFDLYWLPQVTQQTRIFWILFCGVVLEILENVGNFMEMKKLVVTKKFFFEFFIVCPVLPQNTPFITTYDIIERNAINLRHIRKNKIISD